MRYTDRQPNPPKTETDQKPPSENVSCIPSAKIDDMLLDALDALEQTQRLHESTPNPEIKRQAKRILDSLHSSLHQLASLGVHSEKRLARVALPG